MEKVCNIIAKYYITFRENLIFSSVKSIDINNKFYAQYI